MGAGTRMCVCARFGREEEKKNGEEPFAFAWCVCVFCFCGFTLVRLMSTSASACPVHSAHARRCRRRLRSARF